MKQFYLMASRIYEVYITIPPDGGYSWVIAAISFFGYAIADGIGSSFYLYRKRISQDLGISTPMSAAIGSTYSSLCLFTGMCIFFFLLRFSHSHSYPLSPSFIVFLSKYCNHVKLPIFSGCMFK